MQPAEGRGKARGHLATSDKALGPPGAEDQWTHQPSASVGLSEQRSAEWRRDTTSLGGRVSPKRGSPLPQALNKERFAGRGISSRRLLPAESAGSVRPYLLFTRSPERPRRGVETPAVHTASPARPAATAPGGSCSPSRNFGGSGLRPRGGEAVPTRGLSATSLPSSRPSGWLGRRLRASAIRHTRRGGAAGRGAQESSPHGNLCRRQEAGRSPGGGGFPRLLGGPRPAGPPHPQTKMAVGGAPRRPPLALAHLPHRAGARRTGPSPSGSGRATRAPTPDESSDQETAAGPAGRTLLLRAPGPEDVGRRHPLSPSPALAPASSPLVPGLGAGGDASGRLRSGMERSGGQARPLLSLWLPLGRRRLYLTAAVPARTRHMG